MNERPFMPFFFAPVEGLASSFLKYPRADFQQYPGAVALKHL
jgi:hypothetical protein